MIVQIRVRLKNGDMATLPAQLDMDNVRFCDRDKIDDIASDWLDENKIDYKWYRVLFD